MPMPRGAMQTHSLCLGELVGPEISTPYGVARQQLLRADRGAAREQKLDAVIHSARLTLFDAGCCGVSMFVRIDVEVGELVLDVGNPRIDRPSGENGAISQILNLNTRHFFTIMESIRDNGLDPGDLPYVIDDEDEDGAYVVVDGNRRLSAVKLLLEPNRIRQLDCDAAVAKKLVEISTSQKPKALDVIQCVKFDSLEQARPWIERRHGKGLDGEGRIKWSPLQIQRFQEDKSIIDVVEFVGRHADPSSEWWKKVAFAIRNKSSILERLLQSAQFKELFGLGHLQKEKARHPSFKTDPKATLEILKEIMSDIADGKISTRSLNQKESIGEYRDQVLSRWGISAPTLGKKQTLFESTTIEGLTPSKIRQPSSHKPSRRSGTSRTTSPRTTLAPRAHNFLLPVTERGKQLLREAERLQLNDAPISSSFVLRAMIELAVDSYCRANSLSEPNGPDADSYLSTRLERVVAHVQANDKARAREIAQTKRHLTDKLSKNSIISLNDYVHAAHIIPGIDALRNGWDACVPLFIVAFGAASRP
jgi:hypothetical protein